MYVYSLFQQSPPLIYEKIPFLQIQLNTYVPAPLRCNEIVLNYKQLCRSRVRQLEKKPEPVITLEKAEEMDLVLIDESD